MSETISLKDIAKYIDEVAEKANNKKKELGIACGIPKEDIDKYMTDANYRSALKKEIGLPDLSWFRKTKNQDLKDKLTLEGIKRGYSVRAEKTMGALPEYQSKKDQKDFNRFDLSWEKGIDSKDFVLIVEIEMDLKAESILKDFKKLTKNKSNAHGRVMICQAKTNQDADTLKSSLATITEHATNKGEYLLSVWVWKDGCFKHYEL